jgi:hypothetical protein
MTACLSSQAKVAGFLQAAAKNSRVGDDMRVETA